jgi:hypothetical protein
VEAVVVALQQRQVRLLRVVMAAPVL